MAFFKYAVQAPFLTLFCRLWKHENPGLQIVKHGIDYCDYCTQLTNQLGVWERSEYVKDLGGMLAKHREQAREKFRVYKAAKRMVKLPDNECASTAASTSPKSFFCRRRRCASQDRYVL